MATSTQIQERMAAFACELSEEMGEVDDSMGVCWLDAIENYAIEISDAVTAELVKNKSVSRPIEADESTCPHCGRQGRYKGARERDGSRGRAAR